MINAFYHLKDLFTGSFYRLAWPIDDPLAASYPLVVAPIPPGRRKDLIVILSEPPAVSIPDHVPDKSVPKRRDRQRIAEELLSTDWDLLLCFAGSLSAILCEYARQLGRKAIDIGAHDMRILQNRAGVTESSGTAAHEPWQKNFRISVNLSTAMWVLKINQLAMASNIRSNAALQPALPGGEHLQCLSYGQFL